MINLMRGGYDSRAVANRFVELALKRGKTITIMEIVKYVYLAHGWFMGFHGSDRPLISHKVEAWQLGPVIPEVYREFRPQGIIMRGLAGKSPGKPYRIDFTKAKDEGVVIDSVYDSYSKIPILEISAATHAKGTPWADIMNTEGMFAEIPNTLIAKYYGGRVEARKRREAEANGK